MTYDPEVVNDFALVPLVVGMLFAGVSGVVYGIGSPWWRSLLGVAFFGVMVSSSLPILVVVARRTFGAYPGYEWVALSVYTLWALAWVAMLVIILVERRRSALAVPFHPHPRRKKADHV